MIDLNTVVQPEKGNNPYDDSPIPEKDLETPFILLLDKIGDWVSKEKSVKDEITGAFTKVTIYTCNIRMVINEGAYKGRVVFENLSTADNLSWKTRAFLHAVGCGPVTLSQIQSLQGKQLVAKLKNNSYEKKVTDKDTGFESKETVRNVQVARYEDPLQTVVPNNLFGGFGG